ncbi:MAG TPA: diguanylate cyclase, partial [Candidatus Dormibacteraeota bacterium]|nr:diguanylate cyclase [Candidatus Dormibacteraeota bacterium]
MGLAYVVGARVGLHLAIDNPNVTAVWPPTGIAVAALWSVGLEVWPAIAAGALVANLTNGASLATSLAITPGNVLAPLVAWTLLRRLHFDSRLSSVGDVVKLVGIGAFASMLVSATLGTVALIVTGALGTSAAWSVWMTWWLGDASGVVLFAPAVLVLAGAGGRMRELIGRPFETVLWLALTSGVTLALAATSVPILFIAIPVVAGGALRFRQQGAAIAIALVAAISTWATASGLGPYQQMSTTTKLLLLQAFNGTLALLSLLVAAVVTERIAAQDAVQRIADDFRRRALEDPLTGLANRALLIDRVEHALVRREPPMLTILFVDLDDFKSVNDTVGHAAGDQLLVEVAQRLRPCVRPEDTVGRLGGDEFAILLEGSGDALDAEAVADRVRAVLRAPFAVQGARVHIGASIGIAAANADTTSADEVLSRADLALYRAKAGAKGSVEVYEPSMRAEMRERQEIRADLARALLHDELLVQYQPIVALRTREVVGAEALVRRRHPRRGLIPPASFIPVAEQSGMIAALGRRVLECACAQAAEWQRSSPWAPPLAMTV